MNALGLYGIKPRFQTFLSPVADQLAAARVHPDVLTYAGLGCALLGGGAVAISASEPLALLVVPVFACARLALNALDGMVAFRLGVARPWGKVLNEFVDRLADMAFLAPLALLPGVTLAIVTLALCSTLLVSFLGILGEAAGASRQYGGIMGKADRMLWLGLAATLSYVSGTFLPMQALLIVLIAGAVVTLVERGARIHAAL